MQSALLSHRGHAIEDADGARNTTIKSESIQSMCLRLKLTIFCHHGVVPVVVFNACAAPAVSLSCAFDALLLKPGTAPRVIWYLRACGGVLAHGCHAVGSHVVLSDSRAQFGVLRYLVESGFHDQEVEFAGALPVEGACVFHPIAVGDVVFREGHVEEAADFPDAACWQKPACFRVV